MLELNSFNLSQVYRSCKTYLPEFTGTQLEEFLKTCTCANLQPAIHMMIRFHFRLGKM